MKWRKLGKIFEPINEYYWMYSHASVPFAVNIKDDYYRIYFSSRDINNKSHTGYIEMDIKNPKKILNYSPTPILSPGAVGTFDDSGTMLSWITKHNNTEYLYYIGWNLGVTVPFRNAIGLAIKHNNENFEKFSEGPIIDRSINDPFFTASSCVLIDEGIWKMWYLSCTKWEEICDLKKHYYYIKYAESKDGIHWDRKNIVSITFKSKNEYAISRPSVIRDEEVYKMWYSYRGDSYRIGYAESRDGINFTRMDEKVGIDVSPTGWDSEMIEYPFVFDHKGDRYMLYNGNGYGKTGFGLAILEED